MSYPLKPDSAFRFTARTKKMLRSVAHQPWAVDLNGWIRVRAPLSIRSTSPYGAKVCPVCMAHNQLAKRWEFFGDAQEANQQSDLLTDSQLNLVTDAADSPSHPLRRELEQLLGGLRTPVKKGNPRR